MGHLKLVCLPKPSSILEVVQVSLFLEQPIMARIKDILIVSSRGCRKVPLTHG